MRASTKREAEEVVEAREPTAAEVLKGRELVLAVLERAAEESDFLARLADNPSEALAEYYTLTSEEHAALASGDIRKIEEWVGKLDDRLATWLWCRLSQEKW
ncbi:MAG: hypothetical protein HWN68_13255 [Desulfobacterales bacterium]|nr:hypothetical protein [Desulfobacterales bacterium]